MLSFELLGGAAQLKAQHTAEAAEELAGARVARMALEAGVVHLRDGAVTLEKLRDAQRALILMTNAERERHQASVEQKSRVRVHAAAEMIHAMPDALDPV